MIDLSHKQYKLLVKANREPLDYDKLSSKEIDACNYLTDVSCFSIDYNYDFSNTIPISEINQYRITELGKANILSFRFKYHYWYIPIIISVLSLLKSYSEEIQTIIQAIIQ